MGLLNHRKINDEVFSMVEEKEFLKVKQEVKYVVK